MRFLTKHEHCSGRRLRGPELLGSIHGSHTVELYSLGSGSLKIQVREFIPVGVGDVSGYLDVELLENLLGED